MTEERTWRDAKIPQWVKDSIEAETLVYRRYAALSWPTEAKPTPLPFGWGDYDRQHGTPVEGIYWDDRANEVHIKESDGSISRGWKKWVFSYDGSRWSTSVCRGHLFSTKRDAYMHMLWVECEKSANALMQIKDKL